MGSFVCLVEDVGLVFRVSKHGIKGRLCEAFTDSINFGYSVDMIYRDFVWCYSYDWTMKFVQSSKTRWPVAINGKFSDPEIGQGSPERSRIASERMHEAVVDDICESGQRQRGENRVSDEAIYG